MPTLLRLMDLMALLKLNRFHWHFADDEAFRLEIDTAPALWRETAFRGEGCAVPASLAAASGQAAPTANRTSPPSSPMRRR